MSYIRSGSNPEGLYIWGDCNNTIHFATPNQPTREMPKAVFHGLIRKYHKNFWESCSYRGASVKDVWEIVRGKKELQVQLSYEDWSITMWTSTWIYITHTNLSNVNEGCKNKIVID